MNKNNVYTGFLIICFFICLYVSKKIPIKLVVDKTIREDYSYLCINTEAKYCELYKKILFGIKVSNDEIEQLFYKNGVGHLLSISGLHIYSILNVIFIMFNFILLLIFKEKLKHIPIFKVTYTVSILFCCFYIYKIEASIPRLRSLIMLAMILISYKFSFLQNKINVLILSASILAIIYPDLDKNLAFYYSYISVFAIYIAKDKNIFSISFIIFIFLIPLNMFTKGELNTLSIINNIIFVPLFTYLYFPALLVYASFVKVFPLTLSFIMAFLTKSFIYLLDLVLPYSEKLSFNVGFISSYNSFIIFLFILITYLFLFYKFKKPKLLYFSFLCLSILLLQNFKKPDISVQIFDIDKKPKSKASGDFILVSVYDKKILFDTGFINPNKTIRKILSLGITELDLLIISHEHEDHIGGIEELFKQIRVKNVVVSPFFTATKFFNKWSYACKGSKIFLDNKRELIFLNPDCNLKNKDLNNSALAFIIKDENYNYLFLSDIGQKTLEKILVENNIDFSKTIVQYPHHCSKTVNLNFKPLLAFCTKSRSLIRKEIEKPYPLLVTGINGDIIISQKESKIYTKTDK